MATVQSRAEQSDRLGFFLFLAFALHLILILGIGFSAELNNSSTPQLEVTLAQYKSKTAPDEAKFIAQTNQEGSGTQSDKAEITTRQIADFSDNRIRRISAAPQLSEPQQREDIVVATANETLDKLFQQLEEPEPEPLESTGVDSEMRELSESIASLEARLDEQQQAYAERPQVRRLTSLSARQAVDAAYLHSWRSRVEAIGNRYYPVASSRYGIYGDLRLMVAIRYDGSIEAIEILSSSGHAVLDEAAIRIVRMAAPYQPFPPELRATADRLEIIRTWKFKQNRLSSVQG